MFVFPLLCELPSGDHITPVKAIESGPGECVVFMWADGGPQQLVAGPYTVIGKNVWRVDADAGAHMLRKGPGCGCGHPLKRWQAPQPIVHYATFEQLAGVK